MHGYIELLELPFAITMKTFMETFDLRPKTKYSHNTGNMTLVST
jgi:hypothetical protein